MKQEEKQQNENNKRESQTQNLLTEFTPFTGLRLQVPLQWVPIQLMALNGTNGSGINLGTYGNKMLDRKSSRPPLWNLQIGLQKIKKPNYNREMVDF